MTPKQRALGELHDITIQLKWAIQDTEKDHWEQRGRMKIAKAMEKAIARLEELRTRAIVK